MIGGTITTGFRTAYLWTNDTPHLRSDHHTNIFATKRSNVPVFSVSLSRNEEEHNRSSNWNFDEELCLEAAEFFTQLARELKRQKSEATS